MGAQVQRAGWRRWRRWAVALAALPGLLLLTVPVWFPWLLRPVGRAVGLRFETVERVGYWRLQLGGVRAVRPGFSFEAAEVRLLQPVGWVVERFLPGSIASADSPALIVDDWVLGIESTAGAPSAGTDSTVAVLDQVTAVGDLLRAWLGPARLDAGVVRVAGGEVSLPVVRWDGDGHLSVVADAPALDGEVSVEVALARDPAISVSLRHRLASIRLTVAREGDPAWTVQGEGEGAGQRVQLAARFAGEGWLPREASIDLPALQWPTNLLARPAAIQAVGGRLQAVWATNRFRVDGGVDATVAMAGLSPQELSLRLAATGDEHALSVDVFDLRSGLLAARLASPVRAAPADRPALSDLRWEVRGSLDALGLADLSGSIGGDLTVEAVTNAAPALRLSLTGEGLKVADQALDPAGVEVVLRWPGLEIPDLHVASGGASLTASGRLDLAREEWVSAGWKLEHLPAPLAGLLPSSGATAQGTFDGPMLNPRHNGSVTVVRIEPPGCRPMAFDLSWQGEGLRLTNFLAKAVANRGVLRVGGGFEVTTAPMAGVRIQLQQLALTRGEQPLLRLVEPTEWGFDFVDVAPSGGATPFVASVATMHLEGDTRRLMVAGSTEWPASGRLELRATGLRADDLSDFVVGAPEWIELGGLEVNAGWTNGPVVFDARADLGLEAAPGEWFRIGAGVSGGDEAVRLDGIEVRRGEEVIADLSGRVPLVIDPLSPEDALRLRPHGNLEAHLSVNETGPIWRELNRWLGLLVERPQLDLHLTGSPAMPNGRLRFSADRVRSANALHGYELPALEGPRLELNLDESGLLRADAETRVAGQRGTLTARLPLDMAGLTNGTVALDRSLLDPLEARLRLPTWDLAPLAAMFPEYLSPQGTVDLTANVRPGLVFDAEVRLTNAVTKPIAPVGVLRQIQGRVRLDPDGLQLEGGQAELSGQPVVVAGAWRFQPPDTNGPPALRFTLSGTNLALARRADLFLRGDVALEVTGSALTNATVAGQVRLRNSLLLRDLQSLVSGNVQEPASRPPFFSVQPSPWGDWRLDLRVEGDRFLRVVTPVFRGRVSSGLQLTGTLREPVALGDVTVPEGRISFPFGGLNVENGRVSLSRENPFIPQINFQASGLNFGFDVRMDVSGPATTPNVVFSSVPPLTSTQILLMLSSGDIPSQTFSYSARSRLQNIAIFIGKEFLGKLTGDPESDRLTMRSGERVSDRGQLTYTIEYRLSPRWSVFGMQDRFDTYLGGLKWRVFEK